MSEEELEFNDSIKTLSMQIRLLAPQLAKHSEKLDEGTKEINSLKCQLASLKCGEHEVEMNHFNKHIEEGAKWRLAILTIAIGVVLSALGIIQQWGAVKSDIKNIERSVYGQKMPSTPRSNS
jgi:type II secretory pathway component PulL